MQVEPHPYFKRDGQNLQVEVPITVGEAVLGAKIEVPALEGMKSLTVPPGSSSGQRLRIKGQGNPAGRREAPGRPVCLAQDRRTQVNRRDQPALDSGILRAQPAKPACRVVVTIPAVDERHSAGTLDQERRADLDD